MSSGVMVLLNFHPRTLPSAGVEAGLGVEILVNLDSE